MVSQIHTVALYAAINVFFNVALGANVSRTRGAAKVFLGVGDAPELLRASRAHGNNAEYLGLALLMLLIDELGGGSSMVLHALGGALTAGRLLHAHGILASTNATRIPGIVLTWVTMVGLAIYALVLRG